MGVSNEVIIDKKITEYDENFINIGNIPKIGDFLFRNIGNDTYFEEPKLQQYRPHYQLNLSPISIVDYDLVYSGTVERELYSRRKLDDVFPSVLGLLALFTTFFYLLTSGYKSWCYQMRITRLVFVEDEDSLSQPSLRLWIRYLFSTNCCSFFKICPKRVSESDKRLSFTMKKMK